MNAPARPGALHGLLRALVPGRFPRVAPPDPRRTMAALVLSEHGPPEVLHMEPAFPRPRAAPGQALVRVRAVGLNPVDFKMRAHPVPQLIFPKPKIPGTDIAGEVLEAPADSGFSPGDRVFAMMPLWGSTWGGCAEVAPVDLDKLAPMPRRLDFVEAASLPLVALTVMQGLAPVVAALGGRTAGARILVQAAAGGVGTFAVQYASAVLGMRVIGTCGARNSALVRSLGAAETIDYTVQRFEDVLHDLDIVVDPLGYLHERRTLTGGVLRPGGHYVHIAGSDWGQAERDPLRLSIPEATLPRLAQGAAKVLWYGARARLGGRAPHYHLVFVHPDGRRLAELAGLVDAGAIRPVIDRTYPLADAASAHRYLQGGHARGKVVLVPPS